MSKLRKINESLGILLPYLAERISATEDLPLAIPLSMAEFHDQAKREAIFALERKARQAKEHSGRMPNPMAKGKTRGKATMMEGLALILKGTMVDMTKDDEEEEGETEEPKRKTRKAGESLEDPETIDI